MQRAAALKWALEKWESTVAHSAFSLTWAETVGSLMNCILGDRGFVTCCTEVTLRNTTFMLCTFGLFLHKRYDFG